MLVLGESATRDYMSAFSDVEEDTTPWMRTMLEDKAPYRFLKNPLPNSTNTMVENFTLRVLL